MRYISDDGKVFNTEQECCEHEQKIEAERIKRNKLKMERQNRLDSIRKKYEDLQKDISAYNKDYVDTGIDHHINPVEEFKDPVERFVRLVLGC